MVMLLNGKSEMHGFLFKGWLVLMVMVSYVKLFATWIVAYQALLSMGCPRQECWSGLPFLSPLKDSKTVYMIKSLVKWRRSTFHSSILSLRAVDNSSKDWCRARSHYFGMLKSWNLKAPHPHLSPDSLLPCGSGGKESTCNAGDLGWEDLLEKGKATHSSILA